MKFDDQLAAYLYENKSLTLEGIGTFTLDDKARVPNEQEKEIYYPIEGLSFTYNPTSTTDEDIIFFLVKKLHKIEPLIRSDIESYLSNIKVLLNIGNPYTIEGIGTLNRNNQRIYEFTPGNFTPAKEQLNPKRENADHNYPVRPSFSAARFFVIILIVISALAALGGIGWGILNFFEKQPIANEEYQQQRQPDTIPLKIDTITRQKDNKSIDTNTEKQPEITPPLSSSAPTAKAILNTAGPASYKMVFEITKSKERAHSRTLQLNTLHSYTQYDSIPINDSVAYYRLFLLMKVAPADTTRVKDSLQIFFGSKIFMEKQID